MELNSRDASAADAVVELMDPVSRPGPLRDQVRKAVIDLIVHYKLPPGEHLRESLLAEQLGVSRVPVREALLALAHEGWIDHKQARGAFVHVPTRKEVMDTFAVRSVLESEAAALAARAITPEGVDELRAICAQGRRAVEAGDQALIVQANAQFHRRIVQFADNLELTRLLASIAERVNWYFSPVARTRGMDSWDEHAEIIDAMQSADSARASELMNLHTRRTWGVYFDEHSENATALPDGDALHDFRSNPEDVQQ